MNHPLVETLEVRALMSATLANGNLSIDGTEAADVIAVNQANATQIEVVIGATSQLFNAADVQRLTINALGGDDSVTINVNRASDVHGGAGVDTLTGGDGDDVLDGDQGADVIVGRGGSDTNVWDPGDGSDKFDGGDGYDTLLFNGSNGDEIMASTPGAAGRFLFTRNLGNITIDCGTTEHIFVKALGGADQVTFGTLTGTDVIYSEADGGAGNDVLNGGNGFDNLFGGADDDTIDGNGGSDMMAGGDGDDLLIWDPGDGNDVDAGGNGNDTVLFNGNGGDEIMTMSKSGPYNRMLFTRNLGNILLDVRQVEKIDVEAKGGNDTVIVTNSLAGTGITSILVNGGDGNDTVDLRNAGPTAGLVTRQDVETLLQ